MYSDVAIKIYSSDEEKLQEMLDYWDESFKQQNEETQSELLYLCEQSENNCDRPVFDIYSTEEFLFYVQAVKWYSGLPVIDFFDDILEKAKELGLSGEYMILNDDPADDYRENFGPECTDSIRIHREISW
jgi:hypothetical protein